MITEERVKKALSNVIDPDFKKDLVSLNMVKDIVIGDKSIKANVELTTPACPLKEVLRKRCVDEIEKEFGKDVKAEFTMTANVTTRRNSAINILPNVKNIICVASGKGGVGKSTVSVNLAMELKNQGADVGLIDADIHGPSIPIMLGIANQRPGVREIKGKHYIEPLNYNGLKVLSIGLLVDERQAVVWRGPMVTSALKQFATDCLWGRLDYLIIDLPPGTGDVHLTMVQTVAVTAAIIVTTPQEVALADARKAIGMFKMPNINVPIIGVIENMAYFEPEDSPGSKYYIFGKDGGKRLSELYEIPLLGQIPIEESIGEGADNGIPVSELKNSRSGKAVFEEIAKNAARQIAIRNAQLEPTKVVEITTQ